MSEADPNSFVRSVGRVPSPPPWQGAGVLLLTACDRAYLSHALALARSLDAVAPGHHLMIHIINPDADAIAAVGELAAELQRVRIHLSTEKVRLPAGAHKSAYYASARFLRMSEILNRRTDVPVLALDADALAISQVDLDFTDKDEAEICLRQRSPVSAEASHLQVAAGAVWARSTPRSRAFFDAVAADIVSAFSDNTAEWFVDQLILARHVKAGTADAKVRNLKSKYADWMLRDDAVFWMGKGDRKYLDVRYVALRDAYDEEEFVRANGLQLLARSRSRMGSRKVDRALEAAFAARRHRSARCIVMLPRLDLPWKQLASRHDGTPPPLLRETVELRLWWKRFTLSVAHALSSLGVEVDLVEIPAWEITPERVDAYGADLAFVPHRCALDFAETRTPTLFYMQQYLKSVFVVDRAGWGACASNYPVDVSTLPPAVLGAWDTYASSFERRTLDSKFGQHAREDRCRLEERGVLPSGPYVFMPLQIPHDQSIRYFSEIGMADALDAVIGLAADLGLPLVLKAHPANRPSMKEFVAQAEGANVVWSDANVHDLIAFSEGVVTINSGVGFEALLGNKPVVCLGRADYDGVVHSATPSTLLTRWQTAVAEDPEIRRKRYARFVDWFLGRFAVDLDRPATSEPVLRRIVEQALAHAATSRPSRAAEHGANAR